MAVYTKVTESEVEYFLENYKLGTLLTLTEIAEGVENSNYVLGTEVGRFILTIFEKRVSTDDLPFFLDLMQHLSGHGICCPVPIMPKDGQILGKLRGKPVAVLTHLQGSSKVDPGLDDCRALGGVLADLHLAGESFGRTRENDLSLPGWPTLLSGIGSDANEISRGIVSDLLYEIDYLTDRWPTGLPQGVIHGDLFPDNVLFHQGMVSGVIDFYFSCRDSLAYDLAICLNSWGFDRNGVFNSKKAEAIISAYCAKRMLTKHEYDSLPLLCRGSALRFLLTRLYDWMNVPKAATLCAKDPLEYFNKLLFHRTVEGAIDYGYVLPHA